MNKTIQFLLAMVVCLTLNAQTLTERLILTDTKDSVYLNSGFVYFDRAGNYCFEVEKKGLDYFITSNDTLEGIDFNCSEHGNSGSIVYAESHAKQGEAPLYYRNLKGSTIYTLPAGKIESYQTSNTSENVAVISSLHDSIYYYINGRLVSKVHRKQVNMNFLPEDWVSFSENGNVIYYLQDDSLFTLYVNGNPVDSSKFSYRQLAINSQGYYIFAEGNKPQKPIGKYDYIFYIHSADTVLDYVRTVWNYQLLENGAYYYNGDDNGPDYVAVNNTLWKNIDHVNNITLIDKNNYLFTFVDQEKRKLNVCGKTYDTDFEKLLYPALDQDGSFACYGQKDYYLYKFVQGKKVENPLSKYGVRATPVYISPTGESIHYFETDDSIYLYRDDSLIFKPIPQRSVFSILPPERFLPYTFLNRNSAVGMNSLCYIEYDRSGYFVFNGKFSRPLLPVREKNYSGQQDPGTIMDGDLNENGFFTIQKTGRKKYLININNEMYKEIDDLDDIVSGSCYFDGNFLIFYGIKKRSFYQYTLSR